MCHRIFVRFCSHLAPCLVHQDTSFRCPISMEWHKWHWYLIWTSRASKLKTQLNISDLIQMWFGYGLQKLDVVCFYAVQTFWMCQKWNLGWQSEQGLTLLLSQSIAQSPPLFLISVNILLCLFTCCIVMLLPMTKASLTKYSVSFSLSNS